MVDILITIAATFVVTTIGWWLVLRNNKKHFNEWMSGAEDYFNTALDKIDGLSDEAKVKIAEIVAQFKKMK
jgi:hypothetical protein